AVEAALPIPGSTKGPAGALIKRGTAEVAKKLKGIAKKMKESGVDVVVVEGMESGGHIGKKTTLSLVPQAKKLLENTPLVAAGGIYDGKTAAAMFILGADGVQMGTRFLASKECDVNEDYKKAVAFAKKKNGVVYTMIDGEDNKTHYWKGLHYVNRFGFCVLGIEELKEESKN
ncbi:hypothetical protein LCGC14_1406390, partial [marine sediment metagenome]